MKMEVVLGKDLMRDWVGLPYKILCFCLKGGEMRTVDWEGWRRAWDGGGGGGAGGADKVIDGECGGMGNKTTRRPGACGVHTLRQGTHQRLVSFLYEFCVFMCEGGDRQSVGMAEALLVGWVTSQLCDPCKDSYPRLFP